MQEDKTTEKSIIEEGLSLHADELARVKAYEIQRLHERKLLTLKEIVRIDERIKHISECTTIAEAKGMECERPF